MEPEERGDRLMAMGQIGAGVPLYAASEPSMLEVATKDMMMGTGKLNFRGPRVVGENTVLRTVKASFSHNTCQPGAGACPSNSLAYRIIGNTGNGPFISLGKHMKGGNAQQVYFVGTAANKFNISASQYYDELAGHTMRVDVLSSTISAGSITINGLLSSFVFADPRQMEGSFHEGVPNVEQLQMASLNPQSDCNLLNPLNVGASVHFGPELMGPLNPTTTQLVEVEQEAFVVIDSRGEPTPSYNGYICFMSVEGNTPTNYTLPTTNGPWLYAPGFDQPSYIPTFETVNIECDVEVQIDQANAPPISATLHAISLHMTDAMQVQALDTTLDEGQINAKAQGQSGSVSLSGTLPAIDGLGNALGTLVCVYVSLDGVGQTNTNDTTVISHSCKIKGLAGEGIGRRSPTGLILAQDVSENVVLVCRSTATYVGTMNATVREAVGASNLRELAKTEGGDFMAQLQQISDSSEPPFTRQATALSLKDCMMAEREHGLGKLYASGFTDFLSGLAQGLGGVLTLGAPLLDGIIPGAGQIAGLAGNVISKLGSTGQKSLIIRHQGCLLCNGTNHDGENVTVVSDGRITTQGCCGGHEEEMTSQGTEETVISILAKILAAGCHPDPGEQLEIRRICDGSPLKKKIKVSARGPAHPQHKFKPRALQKPMSEIFPITRTDFNNLSQETANHSASTALAMGMTGRRLALATTAFPTVDEQGKPAKLVLLHSHQNPLDDVSYHILQSTRGYHVIVDGRFDLNDPECAGQIAELVEKDKRFRDYPVITLEGLGPTEMVDGNSFGVAMLAAVGGAWSPKVAMTGAVYISQTNGAMVLPVKDVAAKTELSNDLGRILLAPFTSESIALMNANPESVVPAAAILNARISEAPAIILCNSGGDVAASIISCTMMLSKRSGKEQTDPELSSEAIKRRVQKEGAANVLFDVEGEKVPLFDKNWWLQPKIWNRVGPTEKGGLGSTHEKVDEHIANYSYKKLHGLARTIIMYNRSHTHSRLGTQKGVKLRRLVQQLDEEMPPDQPTANPRRTPQQVAPTPPVEAMRALERAGREQSPRAEATVTGRRPRKERLIRSIYDAMQDGLVPRRDGEMAIDALEDPSTASRREKEALARVKDIIEEQAGE